MATNNKKSNYRVVSGSDLKSFWEMTDEEQIQFAKELLGSFKVEKTENNQNSAD